MQNDLVVIECLKKLNNGSETKRKVGLAELLANAMLELNSDEENESPIAFSGKPDAVDRYFGL